MQIENCLILSAGLGTRMGIIGKVLPKPLWPLFEKNFLDFHIASAMALGCKKIYVNVHHKADEITQHIMNNYGDNVQILFEPELLDVGGSVISVAKQAQGKLLVLNCDVIIPSITELIEKCKNSIENEYITLLCYKVRPEDNYNRLIIDNGYLKQITKDHQYNVTYSGVSIIDLDRVKIADGKQGFFTSVADYTKYKIYCHVVDESSEYWDFGTLELYINNIFRILREDSQLKGTLKILGHVVPQKITSRCSYNSDNHNMINLTSYMIEGKNSIILFGNSLKNSVENKIVYKDQEEDISQIIRHLQTTQS